MRYLRESEYTVPASPEEVYRFIRDVRNISKCWPPELSLQIIESRGDTYVASFRLLGQKWTAVFTIRELGDWEQVHETLDFPFGKLVHEFRAEPFNGGSRVRERFRLETWIPLAGKFLEPLLRFREAMIKRCLGATVEAEYRDPFKVSLFAGTAVSVAAVLMSVLLLLVPTNPSPILDVVQRLIPWTLLWFFTHDLAHLIVGAAVGVKFSHYYIGLSNIVRLGFIPKPLRLLAFALGIKIDRAKSTATPRGYASMYAAGPLASMFTPLAAALAIYLIHGPNLSAHTLTAASALNIIFTTYFSPKAGCLLKARNALKKAARET